MPISAVAMPSRSVTIAFFAGQARMRGGQRTCDDAFDIEMRGLHRLDQIAHRRAFSQRHMDVDAQRLGVQPLGIGDAVRTVERVMRRLRMQHHPPVGVQMIARGVEEVFDIVLFDPASADGDLDAGNPARQPGARAADPHALDRGVGIGLGLFHRGADGVARRAHVSDIAALDPVARPVARTQHDHGAVFGLPHDHRGNAEGPDVHRAEDAGDTGLLGRHQSLLPLSDICFGHGPSSQRR